MNKTLIKISLAVLVILLGWWVFSARSNDLPEELEGRWQAVFLDDGQVYFGRLENYNKRYYSLKNVYYLKLASDLQTSSNNLNLIRLGGEAHGPEGEMFINKDSISFIENLKSDSVVVRAIRESTLR